MLERHLAAVLSVAVLGLAGEARPADVPPRPGYAEIADRLEAMIAAQIADKKLPAVSIAIVDDQDVAWARGFGYADPQAKRLATADTVFRVGSVSKLFTDIAVMQLVERGTLDLDAPVTRYLPDFHPKNPFPAADPITLRMLMAHRSGLIREPPVGNYFATDEPSLRATIRSLNDTILVYPPRQKTKYSNAGIATVGYVLETTQREPFAPYLEQAVLVPLGMMRSSFERKPALMSDLAQATMWTLDGRTFPAPTFRFGMDPCGAMYSTVLDLGRFLSTLFAGGRAVTGGRILKTETLETMWTPQYPSSTGTRAFGLGFGLGSLAGHRLVGHGGAVYGFATTLLALPDDKLGVVVVTTKDSANPVVDAIGRAALGLALARKAGRALPAPSSVPQPIPVETARRLAGRYQKGDVTVDLIERGGVLRLARSDSDALLVLKGQGDALVTDDATGMGLALLADGQKVTIGEDAYERVPRARPLPPPSKWEGLIGEYGFDHNTLFILEQDGRLQALIEWFTSYPLTETDPDSFRFPAWGLYDGEPVAFERDALGRATKVVAANVTWPRRNVEPESGGTFHITPSRPVAELTAAARKLSPPLEKGDFRAADLVEVALLDPTIKLDIRYAGSDNFLSTPVYASARAFLERPAAEAVVRANRALAREGYGLLIHDAYRPWYVTNVFWEATPPEGKIFVADPAEGSRHNRGCAVDLTLYELATGRPVIMPSVYDEQSPRAFPDYPGGTSLQRWQRDLLRRAMEEAGFSVYDYEWWHYDFKDWRLYPILNLTFDQIAGER
jgi:CubicO group peptidase (beta-lactamase class C family)/D-alanyl-D-alanine dipeptidase